MNPKLTEYWRNVMFARQGRWRSNNTHTIYLYSKVLVHALAVHKCRCSSPVTLLFEPMVEINPLRRVTGPLWHPTFHNLPSPCFPSNQLSINPFGRMNSWMSCMPTAFVWDQIRASKLVVGRANYCTTEAHIFVWMKVNIQNKKQSTYLSSNFGFFGSIELSSPDASISFRMSSPPTSSPST